ncbi:MAG: chromosomal replication initiator protein DnaA [Thermoleophilia bacterium]|nr:chromosomal replication initiator protein DnaA [Thermoleophilia bacterium]
MEELVETTWRRAKETIRESVGASTYQMWFERADAAGMENSTMLVSVPNDFAKSRIEKRFMPLIEETVYEIAGDDLPVENVRLIVSPDRAADDSEEGCDPVLPLQQQCLESSQQVLRTLNPKYTFESFVFGSSNRFAHAAALAVAEKPARAYNPLFIYGGVGLGKTHLLQAIGHYVATNHPDMTVKYMTIETFTNDFINMVGAGRMEEFKRKYRNNDILLIDDIQFLEKKERTQEEFFHTFNTLYEAGNQIAITSDRPPRDINTLQERLSSRFQSGLITDVQPPDLETRIAILRKKVETDGITLHDPEVLGFIADNIPTNIRELEGALIRVVAHASLTRSPITMTLARETLKDILPSVDSRITLDMIQSEVCRTFSISMADLKGNRRSRNIVYPRHMAMYLCHELTDSSLPRIGERFGGRDHTTVLHAINKVSNLIGEEREVYNLVQEITGKLKRSRG